MMIHNRTVCRQVDWTREDLDILLGLKTPCEPRADDRKDARLMSYVAAGKTNLRWFVLREVAQ